MKTYHYRLFGYDVLSEIELDIAENPEKVSDTFFLEIGFLDQIESPFDDIEGEWMIEETDDCVILSFKDVGSYHIYDSLIQIHPYTTCDQRALKLYLTGTVMGTYLLLQERFAIHGSAVDIKGKAYIFTGASGAGKSSIARAFITDGYKLLSDDVSLVTKVSDTLNTNPTFTITPSYPSQKLWQDTADHFTLEKDTSKRIANRENKFYMDIKENFQDHPLPLGGIIEIVPGSEEVTLETIDPKVKKQHILDNLYMLELIEYFDLFPEALQLVSLIGRLPYYILSRPHGKLTVSQQKTTLLSAI